MQMKLYNVRLQECCSFLGTSNVLLFVSARGGNSIIDEKEDFFFKRKKLREALISWPRAAAFVNALV